MQLVIQHSVVIIATFLATSSLACPLPSCSQHQNLTVKSCDSHALTSTVSTKKTHTHTILRTIMDSQLFQNQNMEQRLHKQTLLEILTQFLDTYFRRPDYSLSLCHSSNYYEG